MASLPLDQQWVVIAELQAAIERVLEDDALTGMEAYVAELGSRLATATSAMTSLSQSGNGDWQPLIAALERQRGLEQIIRGKLSTTSEQIAQLRKGQKAVRHYGVEPAEAVALANPRRDFNM